MSYISKALRELCHWDLVNAFVDVFCHGNILYHVYTIHIHTNQYQHCQSTKTGVTGELLKPIWVLYCGLQLPLLSDQYEISYHNAPLNTNPSISVLVCFHSHLMSVQMKLLISWYSVRWDSAGPVNTTFNCCDIWKKIKTQGMLF